MALLDHLEIEQAVVGGTSLGANVTLEVAALAPERLRGMIIEMPVLDKAIPACGAAFTPLLFALTYGEPAMKALAPRPRAGAAASSSRSRPSWCSTGSRQDPGPSGAVLQGILFGRTAPERTVGRPSRRRRWSSDTRAIPCTRSRTRTCWPPSFPAGRLIDANSIIELRVSPERLTGKIAASRRMLGRRGRRGRPAAHPGGPGLTTSARLRTCPYGRTSTWPRSARPGPCSTRYSASR